MEKKRIIKICLGYSCSQKFASDLYKYAKENAEGKDAIVVEKCNCQGNCELGPNIIVDDEIKNHAHFDDIDEAMKM